MTPLQSQIERLSFDIERLGRKDRWTESDHNHNNRMQLELNVLKTKLLLNTLEQHKNIELFKEQAD